MHEARLNSRQFPFLRTGRPAVRPECTSAICRNVREVRSSRPRVTRFGADGEVSLVARRVSSSAFFREIRGRPGLSIVNATPSPVPWGLYRK
jgi:hypothetical protein